MRTFFLLAFVTLWVPKGHSQQPTIQGIKGPWSAGVDKVPVHWQAPKDQFPSRPMCQGHCKSPSLSRNEFGLPPGWFFVEGKVLQVLGPFHIREVTRGEIASFLSSNGFFGAPPSIFPDFRSFTGIYNQNITIIKQGDPNAYRNSGFVTVVDGLTSPTYFGSAGSGTPGGDSNFDMRGTRTSDGTVLFNGTGNVYSNINLQAMFPALFAQLSTGLFNYMGPITDIAKGQRVADFTNTYNAAGTQIASGSPAAATNGASSSDPVSTVTGEYYNMYSPDLSLGGPLPLQFQRYYGTFSQGNGITGSLGSNWTHNFDGRLGVNGTFAKVALFGGAMASFQQTGSNWVLNSLGRHPYQLTAASGSYKFSDPINAKIYSFNSTGQLTRVEDRNGNALTITQGATGPTQVSDGLGRTLTFAYAGPIISKVTDQTNRSIAFTNDGTNMQSFTDAQGNVTQYSYVNNRYFGSLMTTYTRAAGNKPFAQTFDSYGRVVLQSDSFGNKTATQFSLNNTPGANTATDALNHTFKFFHTGLQEMTSFTDALNQTGSRTLDSLFRPATFTDRTGAVTATTYDRSSGLPATITDALNNKFSFAYTSQSQNGFTYYLPAKTSLPDGTAESYSYDNSGNLATWTGRDGRNTTYTYNSRGQVLTATNQAGGVTTNTYNPDGTLASTKSPAGDVTTYTYDAQKRLIKTQFPDGTSISPAYHPGDQVTSVTNALGKSYKSTYDANRNLKSTTGPLNGTTTYTYNTQDIVTKITDPVGNVVSFDYDSVWNNTAVTNGAGEKYSATYDALYRLKSLADPSGKGPSFNYDAEGRLSAMADALGNTTQFTVDKLGRTTRITTPLNETVDITYDSMSRVTSATDALKRSKSATYESRGLPATFNLPGGVNAAYAYNELGRLAKITDPNGNVWTRGYDNMGRLATVTDPLGQATSFTYDSRDRVSTIANAVSSVTRSYDANGNLTQKQYGDGTLLNYTYDDEDRLTAASGASLGYNLNGRITMSNGLAITRDAANRIATIQYPAGTVTYAYSSRGLLASVTDWAGGVTTFDYDDARRLVAITRPNGVVSKRTYDKNGRVASISETAVSGPLSSIVIARDALGRVNSEDRNVPLLPMPAPGVMPATYDAANQISGATYDAMGRMTVGLSGANYAWDGASRLTSYTRADGMAAFTYDAFGKMLSRTAADGSTLNYVWNYALTLPSIAILRDANGDRRYYIQTPGGSLLYSLEAADNSRHFYHFDETGSTLFLTDDSGAITDTYGVTPYGETVTNGPNNAMENPFVWQGQFGVMSEGSTGLYYMRSRWYDSSAGRFLSRDPLFSRDPRRLTRYEFAYGNPISWSDPTGLEPGKVGITPGSGTRAPSPEVGGTWSNFFAEYIFNHYAAAFASSPMMTVGPDDVEFVVTLPTQSEPDTVEIFGDITDVPAGVDIVM